VGQVDHGPAQVGQLGPRCWSAAGAVEADEGLLHEDLGQALVTGEDDGEPQERGGVGPEEPVEVDARRW